MGLLRRVGEKRDSLGTLEEARLKLQNALGATKTSSGVQVNPKSAMQYPAVWSAVQAISSGFAALPKKLFRQVDDRTRVPATDHRLWDLVRIEPNPELDAFKFRELRLVHLLLWGNSYVELERTGTGQILNFWPLPPWRVQPKRVNGQLVYDVNLKEVKGNNIDTNQGKARLPARNVWHIRGLGWNGLEGLSPISAHREAIGLGKAAQVYGATFFDNDATPSGALTSPETLSDDAYQRMRSDWEEIHQGLDNSHRIAVLEEGTEYQKIGIPPADAQLLETQEFEVEEIARIYNMPPHKLGVLTNSNFSNVEAQNIEWVTDTLMPWAVRDEKSFTRQVLPREEWGTIKPKIIFNALLRGDQETRAEFYKTMFNIGAMNPNEIREKEDMNPVEGGDKHFVGLNLMSLNSDASMPEGGEEDPTQNGDPEALSETVAEERKKQKERRNELIEHADGASREQYLRTTRELELNDDQYIYDGEIRSAESRRRIIFRFQQPVNNKLQTIVNREVNEIREQADELLPENEREFVEFLQEFYFDKFPSFIRDNITPTFRNLADIIIQEANREIGGDLTLNDLNQFVSEYIQGFVNRYCQSSRLQLENQISEENDFSEVKSHAEYDEIRGYIEQEQRQEESDQRVNDRLESWQQGRAETQAKRETNKLGNAVARQSFIAMNVTRFRWQAFGSNCPFCDSLNGKIVGRESSFLSAGQNFQPSGADVGLQPRTDIFHPPAHKGGDCAIVPA